MQMTDCHLQSWYYIPSYSITLLIARIYSRNRIGGNYSRADTLQMIPINLGKMPNT